MRQGTTHTRIVSIAVIALAIVGARGRAQAAHFVKIDEQTMRQEPTQPAELADQSVCTAGANSFANADIKDGLAFVDVSSDGSLAGACGMSEISSVDTALAIFTVVADPGDPGGPVALCFAARDSLAAERTAGFNATAEFAGGGSFPVLAGSASITRSPGAVNIFSDGPTTIHSGTAGNSRKGVFSANPGDTITLSAGEATDVNSTGTPTTGSATASAAVRLSVKLGTCVGEGAPAVSHGGLAVLIALLGALGVVTLARRRSSGPARQ